MSTGPRSAEGKEKARLAGQRASTKHGYYAKRLAASFKNTEDEKLFKSVNRGTDCSEEIALYRTQIVQMQERLANGEITIAGMRGEVFLEDILLRKTAMLNSLLRSQHEMHPEANNAGKLKIELSVKVEGGKAVEHDVPDIEGNAAAQAEQTPAEKLEAIEEEKTAHSLEELFEDP